jgi:hypothetical protein
MAVAAARGGRAVAPASAAACLSGAGLVAVALCRGGGEHVSRRRIDQTGEQKSAVR